MGRTHHRAASPGSLLAVSSQAPSLAGHGGTCLWSQLLGSLRRRIARAQEFEAAVSSNGASALHPRQQSKTLFKEEKNPSLELES